MGQKTHPKGFRLVVNKDWNSRWFAGKDFAQLIQEDKKIRDFLKKRLFDAGIARIEIERAANKAKIIIYTARPGIVIGKKGAQIESLKKDLEKQIKREVILDIQEVRKPEVEAQLVAENVASQLERRVAFRRAMKKAVSAARKSIGLVDVRNSQIGVEFDHDRFRYLVRYEVHLHGRGNRLIVRAKDYFHIVVRRVKRECVRLKGEKLAEKEIPVS